MELYVELIIVFVFSCLFTILYAMRSRVISGIISMLSWFTTAMLYIVCQPDVPGVAWLFMLIGLTMMLLSIVDGVAMLRKEPEEPM